MDLKELLPLLILIGVSVIVSAGKKKKPVASDEPQQQDSRPESPWDDLMRELTGEKAPSETRRPESVSGSRPAAVPQTLVLSETDGSVDEGYSYDQEAIEAFGNRPYFSYDDMPSGDRTPGTESAKEVSPTLREQPADSADASSEEAVFPNGFDPKMAVLYSEILKPRF